LAPCGGDDFYNEDTTLEINIICKFSNLTADEQASFLECLTYEKSGERQAHCLYLHWKCRYLSTFKPPRPVSTLSTGKDGGGPAPAMEAKELLRATFLRALRNAYSDMDSSFVLRDRRILGQEHVYVHDAVPGMKERTAGALPFCHWQHRCFANELAQGESTIAYL